MNTEYALIQHALRNPSITVELKRKGFLPKYFKNEKLGNTWKLIHNTFKNLGSIPTTEELDRYDVTFEEETIPHTVEHLSENIVARYNKELIGFIALEAAKTLKDDDGVSASAQLMIKGVSNLVNLSDNKKYVDSGTVSDEIWDQYLERNEWNLSGKIGITFGLDILDKHIKTLGNGWMVTIAARNGVGKSWFLANAVLSAWRQGKTVAVFSCEMTSTEFLQRIHCIDGQVNPTRFRDAKCTLEEIERFKDSVSKSKENYGIQYISSNPENFDNIRDMLKEINEKHPNRPIEAIYIDAVYLLKMEGESDNVQQKNISKEIKKLAKDFDVPVIVTTQMNREFGKQNDGKTKVQGGGYSIAGSDGFNMNSDLIILLNKNDEAYASFHYIDMILQKFRHGEQGINYMIEMNLNKPELKQVDFQFAKDRLNADYEPPAAKKIFDLSKKTFDNNEAIFENNKNMLSNNILENFKNHQDNLAQQMEENNEETDSETE